MVTCEVPRPDTAAWPPTTSGPVGFARTMGMTTGCARYANSIRPAIIRLCILCIMVLPSLFVKT